MLKKTNQILNVLEDLVRIPSVSSDIDRLNEIVDYVENIFSEYKNAIIHRYSWNDKPSIVIQNFEGFEADIILNGHLDVVPPSEEEQFEPYEKDGKLYARGAGDMKAGDAVMIQIMKDIFERDFKDKKVSLILTCDEEVGGENGAQKIVEVGHRTRVGVLVPDSGSTDEIVTAEKGIFDLEIEVRGKSGHASRPWLGDNAIDKTYKLYEALRNYVQNTKALYSGDHWSSSLSLTKIEGGSATNVIPDRVKAHFDVRITEEFQNTQSFLSDIQSICEQHDSKILSLFRGELVYTDSSHPFVQNYLGVCRGVLGKTPNILKEHGASDGRYFAAKGMPLILHRPTCENIHGKGEYVELDSIETIYQIYKNFIFGES